MGFDEILVSTWVKIWVVSILGMTQKFLNDTRFTPPSNDGANECRKVCGVRVFFNPGVEGLLSQDLPKAQSCQFSTPAVEKGTSEFLNLRSTGLCFWIY